MSYRKIHVRVIAGAAALACAPFLAVPSAGAATGGWDPEQTGMYYDGYASADTGCTVVSNDSTPSDSKPVAPNAAPTHFSSTTKLVAASDSDPANTVTATSTMSGAVQVTQADGNPTGFSVQFKASQSRTSSQATAPCETSIDSEVDTGGVFTLTRPSIVTTDSVNHGNGLWQIQLQPLTSTGSIFDFIGAMMDWSSTPDLRSHRSFYLQPGTYGISVGAALQVDGGTAPVSKAATGRLTVSFGVPGVRTAQHKPSHFVKMPKGQTCSNNTIAARLTGKHRFTKRIKRVRFFGPDVKDKTVRHHLKGRTVKLHVTKDGPVDVNIRVRLRNNKVVNSTASYLQCS